MLMRLAILPCGLFAVLGAAMMAGKVGSGEVYEAIGAGFLAMGIFGVLTLIAANRLKIWVDSLLKDPPDPQ